MLCRLINSPRRVVPFVSATMSVSQAWASAVDAPVPMVVVELLNGALASLFAHELEAYARQVPTMTLDELPLRRVPSLTHQATLAQIERELADDAVPVVAMWDGDRLVALVTRLEASVAPALARAA